MAVEHNLEEQPAPLDALRHQTPEVPMVSWFSVKWRVAVFGKLLCSAASRRGFSRHGEIYRSRWRRGGRRL